MMTKNEANLWQLSTMIGFS